MHQFLSPGVTQRCYTKPYAPYDCSIPLLIHFTYLALPYNFALTLRLFTSFPELCTYVNSVLIDVHYLVHYLPAKFYTWTYETACDMKMMRNFLVQALRKTSDRFICCVIVKKIANKGKKSNI